MTDTQMCVNSCTSRDAADNVTPRKAVRGLLCGGCVRKLQQWLGDIPVDYALLPMVAVPGSSSSQDGSTRTKQPEAPAPLNLTAAALTESRDNDDWAVVRDPGDELWYELPDIARVLPVLKTWADQLREDLDPSRRESV